jgi:hypothetical protein
MLRDAGILALRMMVILLLKNVYVLGFSDIPARSLRLEEVAWKIHKMTRTTLLAWNLRPYRVLPTSSVYRIYKYWLSQTLLYLTA